MGQTVLENTWLILKFNFLISKVFYLNNIYFINYNITLYKDWDLY